MERILELDERTGVDDGVDDELCEEGFEPRDFDDVLWGLSKEGVFESVGVD